MDCRLSGFFLLLTLFVTTSASFGGKEHVHIKVHVPHIINELHHEKKVILVHHPHEDHHHHEHVVYDHGHHGHHGHGYGGYKGGHGGGEVIIEDAGHGHYGGISSYGVSSAGYGGGYGGHSGGHSGGGFSSYGGHAPGHYVGSYEPDHHDSHYHR